MQKRLSKRRAVDLDFWVRMALEPLDEEEIDRAHPPYQLVELRFGGPAQLVHQRPTILRGNHHFPRPCLAMPPGILAWTVDVEGMMRVLEGRHGDAAGHQFGN